MDLLVVFVVFTLWVNIRAGLGGTPWIKGKQKTVLADVRVPAYGSVYLLPVRPSHTITRQDRMESLSFLTCTSAAFPV